MRKEENASLFEIVTTTAGVKSIRHNRVNEIMHNPVGPSVEPNLLYINQSRLIERASKSDLILYDVGLGAAANAIAAIRSYSQHRPSYRLKIISFEIDLRLLEFALQNALELEYIQGFEDACRALLEKKIWQSPNQQIDWHLLAGDFRETISGAPGPADIIFFDPYSPKMNTEMWSTETFSKLKKSSHAATINQATRFTELLTYTQATPVRFKLLKAGFFVGVGDATGLKKETTVASTSLRSLKLPLDARWCQRLLNSESPDFSDRQEREALVQGHPQFTFNS